MNVLQYIEITKQQDVVYFLSELARITIRSEQEISQSKILYPIHRLVEKNGIELSLRKSKLQFLPNEFFLCTDLLQGLHLDNNNIKYFPYEIFCCSQLRQLSLNGNQIIKIPSSIKRLTLLNRFSIESNKLETLPCHAVSKNCFLFSFHVFFCTYHSCACSFSYPQRL